MKFRKTLGTMSLPELVEFYGSAPGADDDAGPELRRRGVSARNELIRMLGLIPAADLGGKTGETIVEILKYQFPSQESCSALESFQSRHSGPMRGSSDVSELTSLRARLSGQMDEAWQKEHRSKSPAEKDLHYNELLLANARPQDRIVFLVDTTRSALDAYQAAGRLKDHSLQSTNQVKVESYAREILALPDLATSSGDGVYHANHALGMLALDHGDVAAANRYLIDASKTPGSWSLNRVPGPDWRLAVALLQRGEREAVCEFLDNVKVFSKWASAPTPTPKDSLIGSWKETIRAGRIPRLIEWFESGVPKSKRSNVRDSSI
jgi:hypothetical protein